MSSSGSLASSLQHRPELRSVDIQRSQSIRRAHSDDIMQGWRGFPGEILVAVGDDGLAEWSLEGNAVVVLRDPMPDA